MKRIIYGFLLFSAALMTVSCGGDDSDDVILGYTTDNTLGIVKINLKRLDDKLPKEEILKDKTNKFSADEKEKIKVFLDGENSGINSDRPLYIMADKQGSEYVFSFVAWLDDSSKFVKNFSKITNTRIHIDSEKKLVYSGKKLIGSINDELIVMSGNAGNPMGGMYGGSSGDGTLDEKFFADFWKREATEKEGTIDQIEKSLEAESDVCAWVNLYGVVNSASRGYIESLAINKLLVDAGVGMNINFDKGKIEFKTNTFFNDEMRKVVEKHYDGKSANYDIVKNIDLDAATSYSVGYVSLDFLKYFIKEAGFEAIVNSVLETRGMSLDDIVNGLNGDYAFAIYKEEPAEIAIDSFTMSYPKPSFVVAMGLNGAKSKKLVDFIVNDSMVTPFAKTFHNNEVLVFGSSDEKLSFLKSNKAATNKKLNKKSGVNSYSWASGNDFDSRAMEMKVKVISMESTTKIEDGNGTSETVIKLDKDKKNALHYIMGYE